MPGAPAPAVVQVAPSPPNPTPVPRFLQATKGRQSISFYTLPEYETWREEQGGGGWKIRYYKGGWGRQVAPVDVCRGCPAGFS